MLHVAFIVALMVQLTKGADLLLRPHQQRWVQSTADTITLWLSGLDPLAWYSEKVNARVVAIVDLLIAVCWALDLGFLQHTKLAGLPQSVLPISDGAHATLIAIVGIGFVVAIRVALNSRTRRWLYAHHQFRRFLLRFGAIIAIWFVFLIIGLYFLARVGWWLMSTHQVPFDALVILLMPYMALGAFVQIQVVTGIIVVFARTWLLVVKLLVLVLEGFMWRVAEYNRGAWAALSIVLTVVIGVAEVYTNRARFLP